MQTHAQPGVIQGAPCSRIETTRTGAAATGAAATALHIVDLLTT